MDIQVSRSRNKNGKYTYWVKAVDSDSNTPALIKVWDTYEIPPEVIAKCLAWELGSYTNKERVLVPSFSLVSI